MRLDAWMTSTVLTKFNDQTSPFYMSTGIETARDEDKEIAAAKPAEFR